ncbi:MAG: nickel-dependent hydrogenase large subunit [Candidatus Parcubacteria bacterium]|nr:nickel-dependent hydrogenase large subunit [Candidatus Parcubacteria bacterium]
MHKVDLSMEHITKIEGDAAVSIHAEDGKVTDVHFGITEYKRFFTEAMKGKPVMSIPAHLARICGTCSNAHIMAAIEACENALDIQPTKQTEILRALTMHGLIIRDHALHLYLFSMPDLFGKDAFLDFDETDETQHQMLHDGFDIKAAGNYLATLVAGRSVHGMYPVIGGFLHFPSKEGVDEAVKKLESVREAVLRLIKVFQDAPNHFDRKTHYMALIADEGFGYINGKIRTSRGEMFDEKEYRNLLEHTVMPLSQASAYKYKGESYLVGALARINIAKENLHPKTKESLKDTLALFPSTDIFHNNLAQAIEILHSVDESIDLLKNNTFVPEPLIKKPNRDAVGIGVVEAPRGTLYHKVVLGADGIIKEGEVIVPTGQNQVNIEEDIGRLVEKLLVEGMPEDKIPMEIEKLIRAYDPCMSCGAHFLKVNWI